MKSKGYVDDDSAFVISVIGVSQTIGMLGLGYIGDKPWLNVPKTYACCLVGELQIFNVYLVHPFLSTSFKIYLVYFWWPIIHFK